METELILTIAAIAVLLALSAFFSGSETALTAMSRPHIHHLARKGNKRAKLVEALSREKEMLIGGILFGNNLVNILASALATSLFIATFGEAGIVYATLVMTALVLIFAEILPKTYALSTPDRAALTVAPVVRWVIAVLYPAVRVAQFVVRLTLRLFGVNVEDKQDVLSAADELRHAIDLHTREGGMVKHERDMLDSILDLGSVDVSQVMVHRRNMEVLNADAPPRTIVSDALASPYTRLPLWRDNPENIIGILHAKTLLGGIYNLGGEMEKLDIPALCTDPWFVPETTPLLEQLGAFRDRHAHFALVVDEYGALMGLVTLEDILEEIVGDITDEHDVIVDGVRPQPDGGYLVQGSVTLRDLNRQFDWNLPEDEATTVAGLVIERAQSFPSVGATFDVEGITLKVARRRGNQVLALRLTPKTSKPQDSG